MSRKQTDLTIFYVGCVLSEKKATSCSSNTHLSKKTNKTNTKSGQNMKTNKEIDKSNGKYARADYYMSSISIIFLINDTSNMF